MHKCFTQRSNYILLECHVLIIFSKILAKIYAQQNMIGRLAKTLLQCLCEVVKFIKRVVFTIHIFENRII